MSQFPITHCAASFPGDRNDCLVSVIFLCYFELNIIENGSI